jgi:hypothetical protein
MTARRKTWMDDLDHPDMYCSPEECLARTIPSHLNTYHARDPEPRPRMGPKLRAALGLPPEDQQK